MKGLYALVPKEQLSDMLKTLSSVISLPIQLIDEDGRILEAYGAANGYCRLLKRGVFSQSTCQQVHIDAGRRAQSLGEPYIFSCHAELNHIAYPLASHGALLGAILIGPFLMDKPDSTLVLALVEKHPLPSAMLLELYDELSGIKVVQPEQVHQLSKLIGYLLSPIIPEQRRNLQQNQEKLYQQARLGETIQLYKSQDVELSDAYPYEKEKELLTKVKTGNLQEAKGVLNDLLGYVFFCEGGRMDTMKNRAVELCTLLSRIALEGGATQDIVFRLNNQFLSSLMQANTLEALCYQLQEIVESFVEATFSAGDKQNHYAVRKATTHIARHYAEPLTLESVAEEVGLSPGYFSGLFRRCTGVNLRDYINQIRIEESKRLLSSTNYPLVDIAIAMGFSDQSYFCKVFKKYTGLTPREYR